VQHKWALEISVLKRSHLKKYLCTVDAQRQHGGTDKKRDEQRPSNISQIKSTEIAEVNQ
jgi:hypothetical protein